MSQKFLAIVGEFLARIGGAVLASRLNLPPESTKQSQGQAAAKLKLWFNVAEQKHPDMDELLQPWQSSPRSLVIDISARRDRRPGPPSSAPGTPGPDEPPSPSQPYVLVERWFLAFYPAADASPPLPSQAWRKEESVLYKSLIASHRILLALLATLPSGKAVRGPGVQVTYSIGEQPSHLDWRPSDRPSRFALTPVTCQGLGTIAVSVEYHRPPELAEPSGPGGATAGSPSGLWIPSGGATGWSGAGTPSPMQQPFPGPSSLPSPSALQALRVPSRDSSVGPGGGEGGGGSPWHQQQGGAGEQPVLRRHASWALRSARVSSSTQLGLAEGPQASPRISTGATPPAGPRSPLGQAAVEMTPAARPDPAIQYIRSQEGFATPAAPVPGGSDTATPPTGPISASLPRVQSSPMAIPLGPRGALGSRGGGGLADMGSGSPAGPSSMPSAAARGPGSQGSGVGGGAAAGTHVGHRTPPLAPPYSGGAGGTPGSMPAQRSLTPQSHVQVGGAAAQHGQGAGEYSPFGYGGSPSAAGGYINSVGFDTRRLPSGPRFSSSDASLASEPGAASGSVGGVLQLPFAVAQTPSAYYGSSMESDSHMTPRTRAIVAGGAGGAAGISGFAIDPTGAGPRASAAGLLPGPTGVLFAPSSPLTGRPVSALDLLLRHPSFSSGRSVHGDLTGAGSASPSFHALEGALGGTSRRSPNMLPGTSVPRALGSGAPRPPHGQTPLSRQRASPGAPGSFEQSPGPRGPGSGGLMLLQGGPSGSHREASPGDPMTALVPSGARRNSLEDSELLPFAIDFDAHPSPRSGLAAAVSASPRPSGMGDDADDAAVESLVRLLQDAPPLTRGSGGIRAAAASLARTLALEPTGGPGALHYGASYGSGHHGQQGSGGSWRPEMGSK